MTDFYMQYPPLPNQATRDFITDSGITATGSLFDDFRTALVAVLGLADHNDLSLDDLWQLFVIASVAGDPNAESGNPATAGRGKSGFVGHNPGHYYAESHRRNPAGGGFPVSNGPDANTLYLYPLQNSYADSVLGNDPAVKIGTDAIFVADAGPFGVGDWAFDAAAGTAQGSASKGAQSSVDLGDDVDWTAEYWFLMQAARLGSSFQHMIDFDNAADDVSSLYNDAGGANKIGIQGDGILETSGTLPTEDVWHHFVIENDAATNRVFWALDGNRQSDEALAAGLDMRATTLGMSMGHTGMAGDNKDFGGYLAHVRISDIKRYDLITNATYTVPTEAF